MGYSQMPPASVRPEDNAKFVEALDKLRLAGADARRPPNNHDQIKVATNLSFYPNTGTIFRDGDRKALPERGVDALIELLGELGHLTATSQL